MFNKKGSAWSTVFWIFVVILITTVAIRHSMTNNLMYANLTANNGANEELQKQQYSNALEDERQLTADKENLKRLQKQQQEDYYKKQLEEEQQKQYEEEQYREQLGEQQKEAREEELRQQQKQEQENYYKQQMENEILEEQQKKYEKEQMRQQEDDYYREQQEQQYQDNPSCSTGWKCMDSNTKGYQYSNCSWTSLSNCKYGCGGTNCNPAPCTPGYLNEKKCSNNSVQQRYQYENCSTDWLNVENCSFDCQNGACKQGCQAGYINEYQCSGDWKQKKYQSSDCRITWVLHEACSNGCSNGQCNSESITMDSNSSLTINNGCSNGQCNSESESLTVSNVIDGDTIKLSNGETVRLIGINAPESGQMCSTEATSKLGELALGKEITLEKDIEESDQYGRLLRYVYASQIHINMEMIRLGLAHKYEYGQNTKYSAKFQEAENEAKQNQGCIWKTASVNYIQDKCLTVTYLHYDAAGNDNYNLNDEYATFKNSCNYPVNMANWTIKDNSSSNAYQISSFTAQSGTSFTLYTGSGTNTDTKLYWQRTSGEYQAVWNNSGDTLYFRDNQGNIVLTYSYSDGTFR
ncbi:MAG TPA: hypothetical protein HA254_02140 [Candidatus Diapherotrites archaeon]|uniref:TNase-like domain-containing protein n=1 Tax=Candidatus Iainarchaeum sp. TaxID=3101447 RepID=A0A7J4J2H5_9ARCH|nr:hypothetical protein [Candidatus Diapherotrites archaeon]